MNSKEKFQQKHLIKLILFLICFYLLWTIRAFVYKNFEMDMSSEWSRKSLSVLWKWSVWILLPVLYILFVDNENPVLFFNLRNSGNNLKKYLLGILIFCLIWQITLLIIGYDKTISGPLTWIFTFLSAAIPEEFMFRGFVYTKIKGFISVKYSIVLTSLLFVLIHYPGWFIFAPHSLLNFLKDTLYIFLSSCLWCWIYEKSKSLYPSILFHGLNNIIAG